MVHYELEGPADGQPVVLVHGFSVPYYIWDPTFPALAAAGLRVLRYDLFGRGYSDRPDLPYTMELFVRQLKDLLEALQVNKPGRPDRAVDGWTCLGWLHRPASWACPQAVPARSSRLPGRETGAIQADQPARPGQTC